MSAWTRRFGWLAGAALLTVTLGGAYVHAQHNSGGPGATIGRGGPGRPFGPGPGGAGGPGGGLLNPRLLQRLQLTDAQREQVKAVMDSHREDMRAIADRGLPARKALHSAITAGSFDESAIRAAAATVAMVESDMAVLQGRIHGEVWQILTPEQQKQANAWQAEMERRMAEGRGGRGGPRGDRDGGGRQGR